MDETKNFTYLDLATLKNVSGTIRKMDEILDNTKEYYEQKIGVLSKKSSRSTRLKEEWYASYYEVGFPNVRFYTYVGFYWIGRTIFMLELIFIYQKAKNLKALLI